MLSASHPQSRSQEVCIIMNTLVKQINYYWMRFYEKCLEETEWICFSPSLFLMEGESLINILNLWTETSCGSAARLLTFPVSYMAAVDFQDHIQDFVLQFSWLCTVLSLDKLLLQVQIREILHILMFGCVCTDCKTKVDKNEVRRTWTCMNILYSYWRNFSCGTFPVTAFERVGAAAEMFVRIWSFPNEHKFVLPPGAPCCSLNARI